MSITRERGGGKDVYKDVYRDSVHQKLNCRELHMPHATCATMHMLVITKGEGDYLKSAVWSPHTLTICSHVFLHLTKSHTWRV